MLVVALLRTCLSSAHSQPHLPPTSRPYISTALKNYQSIPDSRHLNLPLPSPPIITSRSFQTQYITLASLWHWPCFAAPHSSIPFSLGMEGIFSHCKYAINKTLLSPGSPEFGMLVGTGEPAGAACVGHSHAAPVLSGPPWLTPSQLSSLLCPSSPHPNVMPILPSFHTSNPSAPLHPPLSPHWPPPPR